HPMSVLEEWQKRNDAHLAAALAVVRARLMLAAKQPTVVAAASLNAVSQWVASAAQEDTGWSLFKRKSTATASAPPDLPRLPPPAESDLRAQNLAQALQELEAASAGDPPPALLMLCRRLGLSVFERDLLMMCIAMELDTRTAGLCARAHEDAARPHPTFA